ncbi:hypothetical protein AB6A40_004097 [Gnathostoma spinigerum]|uniref:Sulfotransferase domain-containing protein n=1 Tax=Gnathostoma spinigerum TaxID=75299 RepID=A0ABD6EBM8_9BILA
MAPQNSSVLQPHLSDALLTNFEVHLTSPCPPTPKCPPLPNDESIIFQPPGFPKQTRFDGEVWTPIFKPDLVRSAKALSPRDSDVFVCTYPKCGTTWIQHICSQLMNENYGPNVGHGKDAIVELCITSPMIERMGAKFVDSLPSPRLLKTHFVWKNVPKSSKAKYIFCVRNPKDCLTSYFFHNRNFKIYDFEFGDFSTFFELFCSDEIAFGNYFDHLESWLPHISDENVLFLRYEDMCEDLRKAVIKIGRFLGGRAEELVNNEQTLKSIVESSSIGSMKKEQWRWFPESNLRQQIFIRKGGSGDWRNHFTKAQSDRLDRIYRERLSGTIAENWWIDEMAWLGDSEDCGIEEDMIESGVEATNVNCMDASEPDSEADSESGFSRSGVRSSTKFLDIPSNPLHNRWASSLSPDGGYCSLSSSYNSYSASVAGSMANHLHL